MATYAIVKTGGKQYKVAVGDVVKVEKLDSEPGAKVSLPVALVVDGATVTSDAAALAEVAVTGETSPSSRPSCSAERSPTSATRLRSVAPAEASASRGEIEPSVSISRVSLS